MIMRRSLKGKPNLEGRGLNGSRSARPANRNAIHAQGRLTDPYRHSLAVFATGPDALIKRDVVADHADAVQIGRTITNQHGSLERSAEFAIVDAVRFRALEHVFARRDVDLSAAEVDRVDAIFDGGDDFGGIAVAR